MNEKHYVNASYIKSVFQEDNPLSHNPEEPFGLIIATQGPQKHSSEKFWKMVVQNNVTNIVTLCHNISDGHHGDACQYFPNEEVKTVKFG